MKSKLYIAAFVCLTIAAITLAQVQQPSPTAPPNAQQDKDDVVRITTNTTTRGSGSVQSHFAPACYGEVVLTELHYEASVWRESVKRSLVCRTQRSPSQLE